MGAIRYHTWQERVIPRTVAAGSCWNWTGYVGTDGYGELNVRGEKIAVHRYVFREARGEIPDGMVIDHRCRNRKCCNPDHLEAVTNQENLNRGHGRALPLTQKQIDCQRKATQAARLVKYHRTERQRDVLRHYNQKRREQCGQAAGVC